MSSAIYDYAGKLWQRMRRDFDRDLRIAYFRAETDCNGFLLNKAAKQRGVHPLELFNGPLEHAKRYASEELLEHWQRHPRPCLAAFEKTWLEVYLWGDEEVTP
ncbi:hypothetical protein [Arthrobacter sp. UM1]|uniref:hypothetical protein n=1 Tax=Arthrobacter sp. UM1 TaxID=2766776 RepID=UPI001CF69E5D|nr:hypothetical protein [Arthrobacter sp. UM1]MCB4209175.1 hypothetical protein [Arthrobacter sp. UM1]